MKTIKKITGILIATALLLLIVVVLISNKKKMDRKLKEMVEFSPVVPVEIFTAQYRDMPKNIVESGLFYSNSDVEVRSETEGKVLQLNGETGDAVTAGQPLVTVEKDVPESRFREAKEKLEKAEKDLERTKNLIRGNAVTQQQVEAAGLTCQEARANYTDIQKQLNNTTLEAPVTGKISERLVEKGTYLTPGMHVFTISDQREMIFRATLAGSDLPGLVAGAEATLTADALPGRSFTGKIKTIGIVADLSGRYTLEIEVPNPEGVLRSGMTGNSTFIYPAEKQQLIIPRKCIDGSLEQATIFVLKGDSVMRRAVTARLQGNDFVSVVSGLQSGEKVITTGQINLEDGTKVHIIRQKTNEQ